MTTKKKTKPVAYVPPPEPVRTPEEQLRHDVEIVIGTLDMETRCHEGRAANAMAWIHSEARGIAAGRHHGADTIARLGATLAEAHGALDALRKVREWLAPIVKGFV